MKCFYGCGKEAKYFFSTVKKWCCSENWSRCPEMRKKKSKLLKGKRNGKNNPNYGNKYSKETKIKIGQTKIGIPRDEKTKNALRKLRLGKTYEELYGKEWADKRKKQLRKWLKSGHAAYMNRFIKNPSKPQKILFRKVQKIFPNAILNFQVLNFSIDIAIPPHLIAIEYDGSWWHQNKEYDQKRQEQIENEGWLFIRYVDFIPSMKLLKNDLDKLFDAACM